MRANVLIIGYGTVGKTITRLAEDAHHNVYSFDIKTKKKFPKTKKGIFDFMHICFPHDYGFVKDTVDYIEMFAPTITIIESTVKPLTTCEVRKRTKEKVYYSPCRGRHENMISNFKREIKFISLTKDSKTDKRVEKYYKSLGLKVGFFPNAKSLELAKLVATTFYGINIAYLQEVERWCNKYNVKFKDVFQKFSKDGYMDKEHKFPRPYTMFPGPIGGHCVMENIDLLRESIKDSFFLKDIIKSNLKKKYEKLMRCKNG